MKKIENQLYETHHIKKATPTVLESDFNGRLVVELVYCCV